MELSFNDIKKNIKNKIYYPIYLLCGEEPYFIDELANYIEQNVLTEQEKEFNMTVLYGKEINSSVVVEFAQQYPMLSNYQLVIVKEAQELSDIDNLSHYAEKPVSTTILVLCHKYKTPDKRKSLYKTIEKNGVYFESKKIYISKVSSWITAYLKEKGYTITDKAASLITEYIGNDLSKITNEIGKLAINIKPGTEISASDIEHNIGISKDYNIFELLKALENKDTYKATKIVFYFALNKKDHPIAMAIPMLFDFFTKILIYQQNRNIKNTNELASIIGCKPFAVSQYANAGRQYSAQKIMQIISYLKEYDLKTKGVGSVETDHGELFKELIYKILH